MPHIVLTEDQARVVTAATESVEVRDPSGRLLAFLQPLTSFEVEAIQRSKLRQASPSRKPGIPGARVHAMLLKLQEIDEQEGITPEKVAEVRRRLHAGEEL